MNFAGSGESSESDTSRFGALSISYGGQALGITLNAVGARSLPKDAPIVDVGSGNGFFPQLLAVAGAPSNPPAQRLGCCFPCHFRPIQQVSRTCSARTAPLAPSSWLGSSEQPSVRSCGPTPTQRADRDLWRTVRSSRSKCIASPGPPPWPVAVPVSRGLACADICDSALPSAHAAAVTDRRAPAQRARHAHASYVTGSACVRSLARIRWSALSWGGLQRRARCDLHGFFRSCTSALPLRVRRYNLP